MTNTTRVPVKPEDRRKLRERWRMAELRHSEPDGPLDLERLERRARNNLSANDLTILGLVAFWPLRHAVITTKVGPSEMLRVSVWLVSDDAASHYGEAGLFQKSLLQLPFGTWSVGTVVRTRSGYQLDRARPDAVRRALALLPAKGT